VGRDALDGQCRGGSEAHEVLHGDLTCRFHFWGRRRVLQ
jgi:hypothetical protein